VLRKLFHFSGIVIPLTYFLTDKKSALFLAAGVLVLDIILETMRIKGHFKLAFIERNMKESEDKRLSGTFFYMLSSLATIAFFEKTVALSVLCILCTADPLSSLAGTKFGRVRLLGKSLEGTVTFFVVSFFILRLFAFATPAALAGATVACLTELFSSRIIDDNLSIPLVTALALTLLTRF